MVAATLPPTRTRVDTPRCCAVVVLLLLLVLGCYLAPSASAEWLPPRREQCTLHPDLEARIQKDVSFWGPKGITEDVALSMCKACDLEESRRKQEEHARKHPVPLDSCNLPQRILISNGSVYLTSLPTVRKKWPFEHIGFLVELYEASKVYRLPDVEFTQWHGDNAPSYTMLKPDGSSAWPWPPAGGMPAVLTWSKWDQNAALVVPYSGAFRCPADSWDVIKGQLDTVAGVPWASRHEVAFGRWNQFCTHYISWMSTADGQLMKCPRKHLNSLADAHPNLLDTRDTGVAKPVPLMHQNRYKYLVSTDGWSVSSKLDKYLLLGSSVLKAASTRYAFYYDALKPYVHYLPYMVNSSDDIVDVVRWAKSHDDEARRIAEQARRFALRNLNRSARLCYLFRLLTELSKLMRYPITCQRRKLCVPLVKELRFLSQYQVTQNTCRYREMLLQYGDDDPDDAGTAYSNEELQRLHEAGDAWPRDDLTAEQQQQQQR